MTPRRVGPRPRWCWLTARSSGARESGAAGHAVGEVCFNTSMTGYQEIITDPSYAGQIITFTFPHIGNVGTNLEDIETHHPGRPRRRPARRHHRARQLARRPSRSNDWLKSHNLPGICGVDTRAITRRIRDGGAPNGVVVHAPDGKFDIPEAAPDRPGLAGPRRHGPRHRGHDQADLQWDETDVGAGQGLRQAHQAEVPRRRRRLRRQAQHPALPRQRRLQGDGGAGDGDRRGHPAPQARRRVPVERPGRSGGDGGLCRARHPGRARQEGADVRHLPRPPDAGADPGRQDPQDGARPSRRQPAGQGPDDRQGRDHVAEPRLLRHPRIAARRTPR